MSDTGEAVRARLGDYARRIGANTELVLTRWAAERFLARLSLSPYSDRFALKGAHLFAVWEGDLFRSTTDVDLQGLGLDDRAQIPEILGTIAATTSSTSDDIEFRIPDAKPTELIGTAIPGVRMIVEARIGTAVMRIKIDTAFGQPITPGLEKRWYPSLLPPYEAISLLCHPRETMVAEKLAAAVEFGADNTRLRDYFDLWFLARRHWFQGHLVTDAIEATFGQRDAGRFLSRTDGYWEAAFSPTFETPAKRRTWGNWVANHAPHVAPLGLGEVVQEVGSFGVPVLEAVRDGRRSPGRWSPNKGWSRRAAGSSGHGDPPAPAPPAPH